MSASPLLRCDGLVKRYGRTTALAGLDLELERGAPIALVGPNGAGKTTLLGVLAGFVRPSAGAVRVLGEAPGSPALSGRLAALPQDALLDPRLTIVRQLRTLAELQGLGRRAARAEAARALDAVGLGDVGERLPTALSHGMRKRVAFAQALLGEPELMLLDEPTAGVDPENTRAIRELVVDRATRTTFLISSHNLDELERLCGSVVQLEAGTLRRHERLSGGGSPASDPLPPPRRPDASSFDVSMPEAAVPDAPAPVTELTLRLDAVPPEAFAEAARTLPGVSSLRRLPEGDWLVGVEDATRGVGALLALLDARGWRWRHVARGRSLEERLYGERR